ncbi:MAG: hypothetical protein AAF236_05170, partial [Verrucomicrobiota bacterium]
LDGIPVSWGVIAFHPEDSAMPIVSGRIRNGKFALAQETGPLVGKTTISIEASTWESTGELKDEAAVFREISPDSSEPIVVVISPRMEPVEIKLRR